MAARQAGWRGVFGDPRRARAITQFSLEYMLQFIVASRKMLGDDFDAAVVLATIQTYVGERAFRTNSRDVHALRFDEPYPEDLLVPISRLAIADLTGLPKETVRRKVLLLETRGLVRRVGRNGLMISHAFALGETRGQLAQLNLAALRKLMERVEALDGGDADPPGR